MLPRLALGQAADAKTPVAAGETAQETAGSGSERVPQDNRAAQAQIVRPVAIDTAVNYPADATGSAVVILRLLVTATGSVREVEVLSGDEPFASEAVSATGQWLFAPARRGDVPVAARIEFEVRFDQQVPPEPTATQNPPLGNAALPGPDAKGAAAVAAGGPAPAAPGASPAKPGSPRGRAKASIEEAVEVSVQGERPIGAVSLTRAEARQIPGALGDPLRAVDMMPGVTPTVSGLPLYYVRGSPPGNVGYFIDEVRVPFLYHAFLGPSVIHPELISDVTLHPGPYPARFGRYAGAIVSAELRDPRHEFGYRAEIGIFDSGGYVETPFAGDKGSFFFGGRYSYLGAFVTAFTPNTLEFWDYQSLIEYDITPADKVGAFIMGSFDYMESGLSTFSPDEGDYFGTEFHRIDLRYDHTFSADTNARVAFTAGVDRTRWSEGKLLDNALGGRVRFQHRFSEEFTSRFGFSFNQDSFDLELDNRSQNFLDLRDLLRARGDSALGGYTEFNWYPSRWVTLSPGARVDLFRSGDESAVGVDPRLATRLRLTDKLEALHGVGVSHQTPNYIPNVPGARVAGLSGGLQTAIHTNAGLEAQLPSDWFGTASVFQNVILDVTDPYSSTQEFAINAIEARKRPRARAYGFELSFKRPLTRRFGAFASYTLSHATRAFPDSPNIPAYETLSGSDRPHVLNLAGMYTFGTNWRLGLRSVFYSGVPGRLRSGGGAVFDQPRAAPFFRLDARVERRFRWGDRGYFSVVGELLNSTLSTEVIKRVCTPSEGAAICEDSAPGAVFLPNLKLEASY